MTSSERLLDLVEERLRREPFDQINVVAFGLSDRPTKKLSVSFIPEGSDKVKTVHFGSKKSITFLEGASEKKREGYHKRHNKVILKDGTRAVDKLYSASWWAKNLLW